MKKKMLNWKESESNLAMMDDDSDGYDDDDGLDSFR